MCIVCIEYGKGTITKKEALNALNELVKTDNFTLSNEDFFHLMELEIKLEKEITKDDEIY